MNRVGLFRSVRRLARQTLPVSVVIRLSVATIFFLLLGGVGVLACEHRVNPTISTFGSAYAVIVSNSVIGFGDVTPKTNCGKTVALGARGTSLLAFAGLLGAAHAILTEQIRRRRKGLAKVKDHGHVIIAGWNSVGTHSIVKALLEDGSTESIVVLSSLIGELPFEHPEVRFIRGAPHKRESLTVANLEKARAVLVPAKDANDPASDGHALLIVRAIKALAPDIHVSVEIVDPGNAEHFSDCAVMPIGRLSSQMMAQSVVDEGVDKLVQDLVSPNDGATLYRVVLPPELEGKTFGEMLHWSADHAGLVIGIEHEGEAVANPPRTALVQKGDTIFVIANKRPTGAT